MQAAFVFVGAGVNKTPRPRRLDNLILHMAKEHGRERLVLVPNAGSLH